MSLDINKVRDSYAIAKPNAMKIVEQFYKILWADYPETRAAFQNSDADMQKHAFVNSLNFIVDNLDKDDKITNYLLSLGKRHASYGVKWHHFEWANAALLKALAHFFGESWTDDLKFQWAQICYLICDIMAQGTGLNPQARTQNLIPVIEEKTLTKPTISEAKMSISNEKDETLTAKKEPIQEAPQVKPPREDASKLTAATLKSISSYEVVLPDDLKASIRNAVHDGIQAAIKKEVTEAMTKELEKIRNTDIMEFVKKVS